MDTFEIVTDVCFACGGSGDGRSPYEAICMNCGGYRHTHRVYKVSRRPASRNNYGELIEDLWEEYPDIQSVLQLIRQHPLLRGVPEGVWLEAEGQLIEASREQPSLFQIDATAIAEITHTIWARRG